MPATTPRRSRPIGAALALYDGLVDDARSRRPTTPRGPDACSSWAASCTSAENLRETRSEPSQAAYRDAETAYRMALADLERLDPENLKDRDLVARCRINLSLALQALKRTDEAEKILHQAIAEFEALMYKTIPDYASGLVEARTSLAGVLADAERAHEAEQANLRAIEEGKRLVQTNPGVAAYSNALGDAWNNLGVLLKDLDHPDDALRALDQAVLIRAALAKEHPDRTAYQRDLRTTRDERCAALRLMDRPAEVVSEAGKLANASEDDPDSLLAAARHLAWASNHLRRANRTPLDTPPIRPWPWSAAPSSSIPPRHRGS